MEKRSNDRQYMLLGTRIVGNFGATIAVPIVLLSLLGKYLDARWGTGPWMLILGFVLAATLSGISITRKAKAFGLEYQALVDSETPKSSVSASEKPPEDTSKESANSPKEIVK